MCVQTHYAAVYQKYLVFIYLGSISLRLDGGIMRKLGFFLVSRKSNQRKLHTFVHNFIQIFNPPKYTTKKHSTTLHITSTVENFLWIWVETKKYMQYLHHPTLKKGAIQKKFSRWVEDQQERRINLQTQRQRGRQGHRDRKKEVAGGGVVVCGIQICLNLFCPI